MTQAIVGFVFGLIAFLIALACNAPVGMAATIGIIVFLVIGLGAWLIGETDWNWFD